MFHETGTSPTLWSTRGNAPNPAPKPPESEALPLALAPGTFCSSSLSLPSAFHLLSPPSSLFFLLPTPLSPPHLPFLLPVLHPAGFARAQPVPTRTPPSCLLCRVSGLPGDHKSCEDTDVAHPFACTRPACPMEEEHVVPRLRDRSPDRGQTGWGPASTELPRTAPVTTQVLLSCLL